MPERKQQFYTILQKHDFSALAAAEKNPKIRRRFLGLDLLKQGKNFREAAEIIQVSWVSLRNWFYRYKKNDLAGLNNQPKCGRHSRFKSHQIDSFKDAIINLNQQFQIQGKRIRGHHIQQLLKEKFNTIYTLDSVYKLLKRLNLVTISFNESKKSFLQNNNWVNKISLTSSKQKSDEFLW